MATSPEPLVQTEPESAELLYPQRPYHRVLHYRRRRKRNSLRRIRNWHYRRR